MPTSDNPMDRWRLVIPRGDLEVLVQGRPEAFSLPEVRVPRYQRLAWNINKQLKQRWGLDAISLFALDLHTGPIDAGPIRYHATELLYPDIPLPSSFSWAGLCCLRVEAFTEPSDFAAVSAFIRQSSVTTFAAAPFGRPGWFHELTVWLRTVIASRGLGWEGGFSQFHASPSFSLIRFETQPEATWSKAVGEPNTREFAITRELAERCPGHLPQILACRPEWNAWLARECPGTTLDQIADPELWRKVAGDLADLQISSLPWAESLLPLGTFDLRTLFTTPMAQHFLETAKRLALPISKDKTQGLSAVDFAEMGDQMLRMLEGFSALNIPSALGHMDLNAGNIVVSRERTSFLDWAEACYGLPFIAMDYLLQAFRRAFGHNSRQESLFVEAYLARWRTVLPTATVQSLWRMTPALAVFAYAWRCVGAAEPFGIANGRFTNYLSSLIRKLKRELATCPNLHARI